jgi:hypothetical protein
MAMFLTVDTSITIRAAADAVWDYACTPENGTAPNPTEHFGFYGHSFRELGCFEERLEVPASADVP